MKPGFSYCFLILWLVAPARVFAQHTDSSACIEPDVHFALKAGLTYSAYRFFPQKDWNLEPEKYGDPDDHYELAPRNRGYFSPYFSIGAISKKTGIFSVYFGLSYSEIKSDVVYSAPYDGELFPGDTIRQVSGNGYMKSQVLRLEILPSFQVKHTKIMLGMPNLDIIKNSLSFTPIDSSYRVEMYNSTKTFIGSSEGKPIKKEGWMLRLPATVGVEQEMPLKKTTLLIGGRALYSLNSDYYSIIFYAGLKF